MPTASTGPETPELPRSLPRVAVSPPRLAIPAIPSRTLPQGVHADGTPAELPPLPDDEKTELVARRFVRASAQPAIQEAASGRRSGRQSYRETGGILGQQRPPRRPSNWPRACSNRTRCPRSPFRTSSS